MKISIYGIAEVSRGLLVSDNEKQKPKNNNERKEVKILSYKDLISYEEVPTLKDTINQEKMKDAEKAYINLGQKYKQETIKQNDIILPISNMDFSPRFVNWNSNGQLDYIYHQKLIVIRPNIEEVIPEFLFFLLNTSTMKDKWKEISIEGKKYRLTCKKVQDMKINIPDMKTQIKTIEKLKSVNKEMEDIKKSFDILVKE